MEAYKKPYLLLFNAVTDTIAQQRRNNHGAALRLLISAQQQAEAVFLDGGAWLRDPPFKRGF